VDRKGVENYQLLLGGSEGADTSLGTITGPGFNEDGIVDAVEKATDVYLRSAPTGSARYLSPHRHGPVQGGDLWLRTRCAIAMTNPWPIRP
jgi:sulfite reductase (NADPH) hemoprotein beta-component